ncbi:MAG: ketosteroid isomerase-like protein [Gemmatimonadetes bacterium]|nr:ketosteroid isomerase-like protein [Gemmatimonadota bacterium]
MDEDRIPRLARRYFDAFQNADRATMEAGLAEDFTFTSPYDDHISRAAYFERCWPHAGSFRFCDEMKIFAQGDECFVLYQTDGKRGGTFRNTELFRFRGDQLVSVEVFFGFVPGAAESAKAAEAARDA